MLFDVGQINRLTTTMTRFHYKDILETTMLTYAEESMSLRQTFQQDNYTKHTSEVKYWDLHRIEHRWAQLRQSTGKDVFKNKDHLWNLFKKLGMIYQQKSAGSLLQVCQEPKKKKYQIKADASAFN